MREKLYDELIDWYRLIDPLEDHEAECQRYAEVLTGTIRPAPQTLLELGSGAGHNAVWLAREFTCTLSDLTEDMLALSRELNPDCEHVAGDMRSVRLGRVFDAVLVHDAIDHMTTEADLKATMKTAFTHLRPGGAAIFAPDCLRETFRENHDSFSNDEVTRSVRCLTWDWDPDPDDSTYLTEYAFLLRDGDRVSAVHDTHVAGLFGRETWQRLMTEVGFIATTFERPIDGDAGPYTTEVFLGVHP